MKHENWSIPDLKALPVDDIQWIVEPVIAPDSTSIFYGPREAGKTQLIFTFFQAIQEGAFCLGHFRCRKVRAALIEVDMARTLLQMRIQQMPYEFNKEQFFIQTFSSHLDVETANENSRWVKDVRAFNPDWIVFDSLRKIHAWKDEAPEAPSKVYGRLRELFPGVARTVLHHVRKAPPSYMGKGYKQHDDPDAYRGTTAWLDDADAAMYISFDPTKKQRAVWLTRARYAAEEDKQEVIAVKLNEETLLLEPTELSPQQRITMWAAANPNGKLRDVLAYLAQEYPERKDKTRRRWASDAGYRKD